MAGEQWKLKSACGLVRAQQVELKRFLQSADSSTWLCGALSVGRCRWRTIAAGKPDLPGQRLYLYPSQELPMAILVGADELRGPATGIWKMLSGSLAARMKPQVEAQIQPPPGRAVSRPLLLIQQIQACAARKQPLPELLKEATALIQDTFPESQVEIHLTNSKSHPVQSAIDRAGEIILVIAELARHRSVFGTIVMTVPTTKRVTRNDYLLLDIIAAILSAEIALAQSEKRPAI